MNEIRCKREREREGRRINCSFQTNDLKMCLKSGWPPLKKKTTHEKYLGIQEVSGGGG